MTIKFAFVFINFKPGKLERKNNLLPRVSVVRSSKQPQIEIFALLFATLRKKKAFKCVLHDYFYLFSQSDDCFVTLWLHVQR